MTQLADDRPGRPPTLWQSLWSIAAAFFGVQSRSNRERDFGRGKASHFIALGIVFTLLFIAMLVVAVKLMLAQAGL